MDKIPIFLGIVMVVTIGFAFGMPVYLVAERDRKANSFEEDLVALDFTVKKGIVESPSLVHPLTRQEFIDKATELNATVYRDCWKFYVFEESLLEAYQYKLPL